MAEGTYGLNTTSNSYVITRAVILDILLISCAVMAYVYESYTCLIAFRVWSWLILLAILFGLTELEEKYASLSNSYIQFLRFFDPIYYSLLILGILLYAEAWLYGVIWTVVMTVDIRTCRKELKHRKLII